MILGLDIGGANIKIADGLGYVCSQYFPLWQRPNDLASALVDAIAAAPAAETVAVTMTGELADCYPTKRAGVQAIVAAVEHAAGRRRILIYLTDGTLVTPGNAVARTLEAAASNWHALASFSARYVTAPSALLVDIGSTTSDLIPLLHGRPQTRGLTDPERLLHGELVYTGVTRSPLCALVRTLPWQGAECRVAQELFATSLDAYLILGELAEDSENLHTADGQPATRAAARDRLARMICADREMFSELDAHHAASAVTNAQHELLLAAAHQLAARQPQPWSQFLVSGQGEFLARRLIATIAPAATPISLQSLLGSTVSQCAPAHAVAVLAREALTP